MSPVPVNDHPIDVEHLVLRVRRHGRVLTAPVAALLIVAGAAGYFVGSFPESWMNWAAAGAAVVFAVLLGLGPVLAWLASRTLITSRRVIIRRGLFVQHRSEVLLARVREVRTRRTVGQRAVGSGDIDLVIGADEVTRLHDVPDSAAVAEALQSLVERAFAQTPRLSDPASGTDSAGGFAGAL